MQQFSLNSDLNSIQKILSRKDRHQLKACFALLLGLRVGFLLPPAKQSKASKQASYKGGD